MNIQTRASFTKEYLAFFRTNRFTIIAASFIGVALLSPLLISGMSALVDFYADLGVDISDLTGMLVSASSIGVASSISEIATIGLLIFILLINRYAGGEQKKRAVIIPMSSGLRSFGYIFPKFIVYPLSAFVLGIIGVLASWLVSGWVFEVNDVTFGVAVLSGMLVGVRLMLFVCFHLTLGTATGRAGMSAAVCIVASFLLPNFISIADAELMFNPFALELLAVRTVQIGYATASDVQDMIITVIISVVIMAIMYFIALFAQNAKRIDNTGNEISL